MSSYLSQYFPNIIEGILFIGVLLVWAVFEVSNTLGPRIIRRKNIIQHRDYGSYWVIFAIVWGSIMISLLFRKQDWGIFQNDLQYIGIGMIVLGIIIREWAVFTLGKFFTVVVTITSDQTLVTRGPYQWLRHPSYTGSILSLVGFPLAIGTWSGSLIVLLLCLSGFLYRIQIEEKILLSRFGDEYQKYIQHTWKIFPGI